MNANKYCVNSNSTIHDNFSLVNSKLAKVNKADFLILIQVWKNYFKNKNVIAGSTIYYLGWLDEFSLALLFACMESGVCLETTSIYFETTLDSVPKLYNTVKLVVSNREFMHNKNNDRITYYEDIFTKDTIFDTVYIEDEFLEDYPIIKNYTSGTTGAKKQILHNYNSLIAAAKNAATFYRVDERILGTATINHLGVVAMHILGPVLAGSCMYVCKSITDIYFLTDRKLIDTFSGFEIYVKNMMRLGNYLSSHLDLTGPRIITGGSTLSTNLLDLMFTRGASEILYIYGANECLPPVMYKRIFKDTSFIADANCLGTLITGFDVKIKQEKVLISGPSAGDYLKDQDGYIHLNDRLDYRNDSYYFKGREQYLKNYVYEEVVQLTEQFSNTTDHPLFKTDFDYGIKDEKVYLLLEKQILNYNVIDIASLTTFLKLNKIDLEISGVMPKPSISGDAIKGNKIYQL